MPPWLVNLLSNRLFWVMLFVVGIPTLKFIVRTISAARAKKIAYDSSKRREEEYLRTGRISEEVPDDRQVSAREELEQMAARRRAEFERARTAQAASQHARSVSRPPTQPAASQQVQPSMPPPMPVDASGRQPRSTRSPAELAQRRARAEERAKREARLRQQQQEQAAEAAHAAAVERQAREDAEDLAAAQQRRRTVAQLAAMGETPAPPAGKGATRPPRQREEIARAAAGQPFGGANWRRAIVLAEVLSTPVSLR